MIELPTPYIINTYHEDDVHTHTALFTADQMSDYGRAEYLSAIEQAAQPVREPLTDKSIMNIYEDCDEGGDALAFTLGFARAIERAHGIGGDK